MSKPQNKNQKDLTPESKAQVKRAAFRKVVTPRVGKALKAIGLIGNCASDNYLSTPGQVGAILASLQHAVDTVAERYKDQGEKRSAFELPVQ